METLSPGMPAPSVKVLSAARLDDAVALARSIGWPDVADDWRVLFAAARVFGAEADDGSLAAVGALADFGAVSFVGKMIVRSDQRRRGLGSLILRQCLDARGETVVGLSATDAGRPLYERHGFRDVDIVHIHRGLVTGSNDGMSLRPLDERDLPAVCALDSAATGADRSSMLRARLSVARSAACACDADGALLGFAMATTQGSLSCLGPVIAFDEPTALALVRRVAPKDQEVRVDVAGSQPAFRRMLVADGLGEVGTRTLMTEGGRSLPGRRERVLALAAQAFG